MTQSMWAGGEVVVERKRAGFAVDSRVSHSNVIFLLKTQIFKNHNIITK